MSERAKLPSDATARKHIPIVTGVLDYFPDAIAAVAECSRAGSEQHHPGQPLHWDRSKSTDEADALGRHLMQRGTMDRDGIRHSAKVAWRALALLQKEIEAERAEARNGALHAVAAGQNGGAEGDCPLREQGACGGCGCRPCLFTS